MDKNEFKNYIENQNEKIKNLTSNDPKIVIDILKDVRSKLILFETNDFRNITQKRFFESGKITSISTLELDIDQLENNSENKHNYIQQILTLGGIISIFK
jgi:hypothetical protein